VFCLPLLLKTNMCLCLSLLWVFFFSFHVDNLFLLLLLLLPFSHSYISVCFSSIFWSIRIRLFVVWFLQKKQDCIYFTVIFLFSFCIVLHIKSLAKRFYSCLFKSFLVCVFQLTNSVLNIVLMCCYFISCDICCIIMGASEHIKINLFSLLISSSALCLFLCFYCTSRLSHENMYTREKRAAKLTK